MEEIVRGKSVELELEPHPMVNQLTDGLAINNSFMSDLRVTQLRLEVKENVISIV